MVMTMKLKYMGWVALSGLFAVSLVGCAAQSSQTAPAGSEQAVVQTEAVSYTHLTLPTT